MPHFGAVPYHPDFDCDYLAILMGQPARPGPGQEVPLMQQQRVFAVRDGFITLIKYKDMP